MRGIQRPGVFIRINAALHVEVVIDHVVSGMCEHQTQHSHCEIEVVCGFRQRNSQQTTNEARCGGHREHRCAGDDQPLAHKIHFLIG